MVLRIKTCSSKLIFCIFEISLTSGKWRPGEKPHPGKYRADDSSDEEEQEQEQTEERGKKKKELIECKTCSKLYSSESSYDRHCETEYHKKRSKLTKIKKVKKIKVEIVCPICNMVIVLYYERVLKAESTDFSYAYELKLLEGYIV